MKRIAYLLIAMVFIFSIVGVQLAEAKGSISRSSSTSRSSSSSYKSSSTTKSTTTKSYSSKPKSSTTTKSTTSTTKSTTTTSKPKVNLVKGKTLPKTKSYITHKTTTINNHTVVYKTKYVSPPKRYSHSYYNSHYSHYPYYHNGSFSNQLLTAAGVYLFLESFDDDGSPIYVDDDGNRASASVLGGSQPYQDNGTSGWTILFAVLFGILGFGILGYILGRKK